MLKTCFRGRKKALAPSSWKVSPSGEAPTRGATKVSGGCSVNGVAGSAAPRRRLVVRGTHVLSLPHPQHLRGGCGKGGLAPAVSGHFRKETPTSETLWTSTRKTETGEFSIPKCGFPSPSPEWLHYLRGQVEISEKLSPFFVCHIPQLLISTLQFPARGFLCP